MMVLRFNKTSKNPIKDKVLTCFKIVIPSFSIRSPPQPINATFRVKALISLIKFAPCKSPDTSPATIKILVLCIKTN